MAIALRELDALGRDLEAQMKDDRTPVVAVDAQYAPLVTPAADGLRQALEEPNRNLADRHLYLNEIRVIAAGDGGLKASLHGLRSLGIGALVVYASNGLGPAGLEDIRTLIELGAIAGDY